MRNKPWVWPKVGDAGKSGAEAVPLRSAQMIGQQKKNTQQKEKAKKDVQTSRKLSVFRKTECEPFQHKCGTPGVNSAA